MPAMAWLFRKCPVRRTLHAGWIQRAACWGPDFPVYTFKTNIAPVRWSTAAMPDLLTRHLLFEGLYQEDVLEAIRGLTRAGDVVLDIGAHHGFMTCVAAGCAGSSGCVISFEPNPHALARLRSALKLNQLENVTVMDKAVGDKPGRVTLNVQKGTATWNTSLFRDMVDTGYEVEAVEVDMITVDAFVEETGLFPSLMKIDVEGAEFLVIQGARQTLRQHRPALIMEFNPIAAAAAHSTIQRLVDDLTELNYDLRVLTRNRLGRYSFKRSEPFDEARHCHDDLANVVCIPR